MAFKNIEQMLISTTLEAQQQVFFHETNTCRWGAVVMKNNAHIAYDVTGSPYATFQKNTRFDRFLLAALVLVLIILEGIIFFYDSLGLAPEWIIFILVVDGLFVGKLAYDAFWDMPALRFTEKGFSFDDEETSSGCFWHAVRSIEPSSHAAGDVTIEMKSGRFVHIEASQIDYNGVDMLATARAFWRGEVARKT